jgi:acyl-ACP thioesterase
MNLVWQERFKLRTYDVDFNNKMKVSSLFNFMQEAASNSANTQGFGYDDMVAKQLYWVISRAKIEFSSFPVLDEEIIIETWPRTTDKLYAIRDFIIYHQDKTEIARATTSWLMINGASMRPQRLNSSQITFAILEEKIAVEALCEKLELNKENKTETINTVKIGYNDIDINQHVSNVKYVELIFNAYPIELLKKKQISKFEINFMTESKHDDVLTIKRAEEVNSNATSFCFEAYNQNDKQVVMAIVE